MSVKHPVSSIDEIGLCDLLTSNVQEICRRTRLSRDEVQRYIDGAIDGLHSELGFGEKEPAASPDGDTARGDGTHLAEANETKDASRNTRFWTADWEVVSTLDDRLDSALGGGLPAGYVTEITGESGAGKTQFLLTLLLAVQLSRPYGLDGCAIYVSTESPLPTRRLLQLIDSHPAICRNERPPSMQRILTMNTADNEELEHVLRFQLPVAMEKFGVRLVVVDSIAAHFRAERVTDQGTDGMMYRSSQLVEIGGLLRDIARSHSAAVVVANQVSDRFVSDFGADASGAGAAPSNPMTLDYQQRWHTGWGDVVGVKNLKTPSLGLVWANQISCRLALIKEPIYADGLVEADDDDGVVGSGRITVERELVGWSRWVRIVYSAWAAPTSGTGIKLKISQGGITSVPDDQVSSCDASTGM